MTKARTVLIAAAVSLWSLALAPPAGAVVCLEEPGSCCEGVEVLGKEIVHIDC